MIEVDGEMIPNYDATMVTFEEGDIVTGIVVRVDKDEVLVDIGYKSEGVVPANELSIKKSVDPGDEVSVGDEIDALVLTKEDPDGRLILSKKRARFERAWQRIEKAAEEGTPVEGTVIEVVKGGLIIDLGVRGFLPASLVDIRRVADLEEFLGKPLLARVIELNRFRNNVVLSRRAVLEEERRGVREQILDRMNVGDLVTGTVSNIVDFGSFVDLNGIDGLIHISELSWSHVNHPSEVLTIGQEVNVKVLDIDRDRQRISLGLKQTQKDPWQEVFENRQVNEIVHGRVTKLVSFGAFVEIEEGVEGLIHISELAQHHVEDPNEILRPGQEVNVKIIEIDPDRRRLSLSLKRLEAEYRIHEDLLAEEEEGEEYEAEGEGEAERSLAEPRSPWPGRGRRRSRSRGRRRSRPPRSSPKPTAVAEAEAEAAGRDPGRSRGHRRGQIAEADAIPRRPKRWPQQKSRPPTRPGRSRGHLAVAEVVAEAAVEAAGEIPPKPRSLPKRCRGRRSEAGQTVSADRDDEAAPRAPPRAE